ncbi:hypothetical protein ABKA04_005062 [Annulohypoxylon sp. FPYF3050]
MQIRTPAPSRSGTVHKGELKRVVHTQVVQFLYPIFRLISRVASLESIPILIQTDYKGHSVLPTISDIKSQNQPTQLQSQSSKSHQVGFTISIKMKNVFAILFLALVSSFVTGLPAVANERRAVAANALEIAARALELTPRAQLEDRAGNSTESFTRSLGKRQGSSSSNSTSSFSGSSGSGSGAGGNKARSLVARQSSNSSDSSDISSLFERKENSTDAETEKRAPEVKRLHLGARQFNETSA